MPLLKRGRSGKGRPEVRRQSRARAGPSKLSPAQKMQKMRRWFERNDGIPPRGDTSPGFDMGNFWARCCSGRCNKELFAVALSESQKMKSAYETRLEGNTPRGMHSPNKRRRTSRA